MSWDVAFCSSRQDTVFRKQLTAGMSGMAFPLWVYSLDSLHQGMNMVWVACECFLKNFNYCFIWLSWKIVKVSYFGWEIKKIEIENWPILWLGLYWPMSKCFSEHVFNLYCSLFYWLKITLTWVEICVIYVLLGKDFSFCVKKIIPNLFHPRMNIISFSIHLKLHWERL